tara:strand:+ start:368 stop:532 length:165 start_codon:yes stop_codon:yes gene_type:complete
MATTRKLQSRRRVWFRVLDNESRDQAKVCREEMVLVNEDLADYQNKKEEEKDLS